MLAVFRLWWPHLSTDQHQISCTDKIQQCRLCGDWNRKQKSDFLETCEFRIWLRWGITSTILYRFSPNFASGSGMSSHQRLFVTQTGSSLLILEVCGFWFRPFAGSGEHIFQPISTTSHVQIKFGNADFYLYIGSGADRLKDVLTRAWKLPKSESAHL